MPRASHTCETTVSPERLHRVITHFAAYPAFVEGMRSVTVLSSSDKRWSVRFVLDVLRPITYTLSLWETAEGSTISVRWSLVESDIFRSNEGSWRIEPTEQGCRVTYTLSLELALHLPAPIVAHLSGTRLPEMVAAFAERARAP